VSWLSGGEIEKYLFRDIKKPVDHPHGGVAQYKGTVYPCLPLQAVITA
jgi:glutamine synthetase